jgi:hypothetical protein
MEESFSRRERYSTYERELVNLPNPEEVKRRKEKLEYISTISSREWLREAEGMDHISRAKVTHMPSKKPLLPGCVL